MMMVQRRDEFTIVLAYGADGAAAAAAVGDRLRAQGHRVSLVELGSGDAPLMEACAQVGGQGLFVVARTDTLTTARCERLRELLRDLGVPMSRSLSLPLAQDPSLADAFVARVATLVRRIAIAPPRRASSPDTVTTPAAAAVDVPAPAPVRAADPPTVEPITAVPRVSPPTSPALMTADVVAPRVQRSRRAVAATAGTLAALAIAAIVALRPAAPEAEAAGSDDGVVRATTASAAATQQVMAPPTATPSQPVAIAAPAAAGELPTAEDAPAIVAALRKREIRALDVFVVAPESKKPADYAGAAALCDAMEVAGIKGWRLPEIGELISMSRAKMLRKGSYWSVTKGDTFGDLRLVLVIKRERISPVPAGWDAGRVICVRERS